MKEIAAELGVDPKKVGKFKQNNSVRIKYMMGRKIDGTPMTQFVENLSELEQKTTNPVLIEKTPEAERKAPESEREAPKPEQEATMPEPEALGDGAKLRAMNAAIAHLETLVGQACATEGVLEIATALIAELKCERLDSYGSLIDWNGIADRLEA